MTLDKQLKLKPKNPTLILLCRRIDQELSCEYLGTTLNIGNMKYKIDTLRFNDSTPFYSPKTIISRLLINDELCGLIPITTQFRKDLIEYTPSIYEGYIIAMRKKSRIQSLLQ